MRTQEISNLMGLISNTQDLLRAEKETWQVEFEAMDGRYQKEGHLLPDKKRENLERRLEEVSQLLRRYNRALFGLSEAWNELECGKMHLDKLSNS